MLYYPNLNIQETIMNKNLKQQSFHSIASLSLVCAMMFTSVGQAKECYNGTDVDVKWISYKTLAKVGVGGNFSKVNLSILNKDAADVKSMLTGASVTMALDTIDAHMDLKNSNIATFFTANLDAKDISAKIVSATDKGLELEVTLNKMTKTIPMKYTVTEGIVEAQGVIDALDFGLTKALHELNMNVAGHKKKGWNDISISFTMNISDTCK